MDGRPNVLFLCTGNSARSQIAEALLRHHAGDHFAAHSAGVEPADEIHPLAVAVLAEHGIPVSSQKPKDASKFLGRLPVDHLITVCSHAAATCPTTWPGILSRTEWSLDDPAAAEGSESERLEVFRSTFEDIERRVLEWVEQMSPAPRRSS